MNDNNLRVGSLLRPETGGPTLRTPRPNRSADVLLRDHRRSRFSTCISSPAIVPLDLSSPRRVRRCGRIRFTGSGKATGRSRTRATTHAAFAPIAANNGTVSPMRIRASTQPKLASSRCAALTDGCCSSPRRETDVSCSSARRAGGPARRARLLASGRAT